MRKMSIKAKFLTGAGCILLVYCTIAAAMEYYYLRSFVIDDIYKETEIFIGTADATRTYVKDVLRPKVQGLMPADAFIPHAMSTSFVGREIMQRLQDRFPQFEYKRAANNPMNPINQADKFEQKMLDWFSNNPDAKEWEGMIEKRNHAYFTRLRAIYAEAECLYCHGKPEDAPAEMKRIYGVQGGYNYKTGDVVAADTVYIPVGVSFVRIKAAALNVFLIAVTSLFALMTLFYLLFNRTVVSELRGLLTTFRNISVNDNGDSEKVIEDYGDEIEQIRGAFESVAADLKQTHDELKASESEYRLLFESSQDTILVFDKETRIKDINPAGIALFKFTDHAEAQSIETFYQLFWDTRDAEFFFRSVKEKGFVQGLEFFMVDRDGKKLTVMVSATVRLNDHEEFNGIDATLRDITEKRRLEKHFAQTEKLASIGQLASGIAHEINNPLGVIKCYTHLIEKSPIEDGPLKKDIEIIRKHTDQCKSIVEALLNFARVSEPKKTKTEIHACIDEVLAFLELRKHKQPIDVRKAYDPDCPPVTVDKQKIKQVLMNLLMNAAQAMPHGGEIIVRTVYQNKNGRLKIEIIDTGTGISDPNLGRIFDPFFTTKEADKGTGLGLSVSYGIVQQHGGDIEVESDIGKGSTFRVILPVGGILQPEGNGHD